MILLLILFPFVWAYVPVPNAIGPIDGCDGGSSCKPLAQCSVWYAEFYSIPQRSCAVTPQLGGVCCPDIIHVRAKVPKFLETTEPRLVPIPPVPRSIVEEASQSARLDLIHMRDVEAFLANKNMMVMGRSSMAWAHSSNMAPTLEAADQSAKGLLAVNTVRRLQDRLQLSPTEAGIGLQTIDTRETSLRETCLPSPICLPSKYRSYDGSCNNLQHPNWGRAITPLERILPPQYSDGVWLPRLDVLGHELPSVRVVSNIIATSEDHPSIGITHMAMQWGQFLDHDLTHVPVFQSSNQSKIDCCTPNGGSLPPDLEHPHCFPINILPQDPFYGPRGVRCLNFVRSMVAPRADCRLGFADQMNQLTHFIDGSQIYGTSEDKTNSLRQFAGGLLAVSFIDGRPFPPQDPLARGCIGRGAGLTCFVAGDGRANQIMGLTSLHVVFLRQHNQIAHELSLLNPQWNDEILFQETRRIIIALLQHITYNEFLSAILGRPTMEAYGLIPQTSSFTTTYDERVNPSITNEFAAAAYRMGHSMIQGAVHLIEEDGSFRVELMRNWFDNPHLLRQPGILDAVLRGLTQQWAQDNDEWVTEDVTNHLFQSPGRDFGFDLISLNLWRGRDHGLPGYNEYRQLCGLGRVERFEQLADVMNKEIIGKLASIYRTVDDIDLYIAGLSERHVGNSVLGPTFSCIIADQFARLKEGDRFFYEHGGQPSSFTPAQLQEIRKMSLAAVLCDNGDRIHKMQPLVFHDPSPSNLPVPCNSPGIPRMSLLPWKE